MFFRSTHIVVVIVVVLCHRIIVMFHIGCSTKYYHLHIVRAAQRPGFCPDIVWPRHHGPGSYMLHKSTYILLMFNCISAYMCNILMIHLPSAEIHLHVVQVHFHAA